MLKIFRKLREVIDPMIGQTVIHFISHGCMGTEEEFDYIGKIIGIADPGYYSGSTPPLFYKVKIEKGKPGRDFAKIPSWYLLKKNGFYIAYD